MLDIKHYKPLKETIKAYTEFQESFPQDDTYEDNNDILFEYVNLNVIKIKTAFYKEYNKFFDTEYFFGCSFKMYKKTYDNRLNDFTLFYPDSDEIDFINDELSEGILKHKFQKLLSDYRENLELQVDLIVETKIILSLGKRLDFLKNRAKLLGFDLSLDSYDVNNIKENFTVKPIKNLAEKKEEILIDYSQSKLTEKIIALNEAGVLDFLRNKEPFNFSANRLAEFLSLCLGEQTESIQSYINPIINKSDQKKSPYNTPKTVEKVKLKLIQIGLKIE